MRSDALLRIALGLHAMVDGGSRQQATAAVRNTARTDLLKTATALAQRGIARSAFSSPTPPEGKVGEQYLHKFVADGTPPIAYGIATGALPEGLSLQPDGTLSRSYVVGDRKQDRVLVTNRS
jgi:hypothetical protein